VIARGRSRTAARPPRNRIPQRAGTTPDARDLEVLADLRDQLRATDPELATSLGRLGVPSSLRWWLGMPLVLAGLAGLVSAGGLGALALATLLGVLGCPLLVALALPCSHGPLEGPPSPGEGG
jgi:hypothetical protein